MTRPEAELQRWLEEMPGRLTSVADLICFPGAGAGASAFRSWRAGLPTFATMLACQLPGRESRIEEPPPDSLSEAAESVALAYLQRRARPRPAALFGHSMGGVLAFEVARRLSRMGRTPRAIVISAGEPPRPGRRVTVEGRDLEALLLAYDPDNEAVIGNAELATTLIPVLESDISLLRRHSLGPDDVLADVPVWLLNGSDDRVVPGGAVARWAGHFTGNVTTMELPGGHQFPFRESRNEVVECLRGILCEAAGRGRR